MKKIFFLAAVALSSSAASAQLSADPVWKFTGSPINIIPSEFTKANSPEFVVVKSDGTSEVYSPDFSLKTTLASPSVDSSSDPIHLSLYWNAYLPDVTYILNNGIPSDIYSQLEGKPTVTTPDGKTVYIFKTLGDESELHHLEGWEFEPITDLLVSNGINIEDCYDKNTITQAVWYNRDSSRWEMYYFPEFYEIGLRGTGERYNNRVLLKIFDRDLNYSSPNARPVNFHYSTETSSNGRQLCWTQTLFNDDEKYECLVPEYGVNAPSESQESGWEGPLGGSNAQEYVLSWWPNFYEKFGGNTLYTLNDLAFYQTNAGEFGIIGYSVVDSDGNKIATAKITSGVVTGNNPQVLSLNGYTYLAIESSEGLYLFEIDRQTNSLRNVGAPIDIAVYPTMVKSGANVNVRFSSSVKGANIGVTSASGSRMSSRHASAGEESAEISTAGYAPGVYMVNVTEEGGKAATSKIVVK